MTPNRSLINAQSTVGFTSPVTLSAFIAIVQEWYTDRPTSLPTINPCLSHLMKVHTFPNAPPQHTAKIYISSPPLRQNTDSSIKSARNTNFAASAACPFSHSLPFPTSWLILSANRVSTPMIEPLQRPLNGNFYIVSNPEIMPPPQSLAVFFKTIND